MLLLDMPELPVDARGQVLAIKGVRVYSWNEGDGVSLTAWEVSEWDINPDISSTANLLRWWNEEGGSKPTHLLQSIGPPVRYALSMVIEWASTIQ